MCERKRTQRIEGNLEERNGLVCTVLGTDAEGALHVGNVCSDVIA